jgi:serine/threonine-protein kinase RsbW
MSEPPAHSQAGTLADPDAMSYAKPADLADVRAFVRSRTAALGLPSGRADLLVLAVSELATNTLQHTDGGGRIRVWGDAGRVLCDIVDGGPLRTTGRGMPAAETIRGRGLAIVERVCDGVEIAAVGGGTRVRIWLDV